jgi:hypothetical protein
MASGDMGASWDGFIARVDARLEGFSRLLERRTRLGYVALTVGSSLGIAVLFFSPRISILLVPTPGSYEWARAETYLAQCAHPFSPAAEPAMQWRLLPSLAAYLLRLPGRWPLAIPWVGLIAFLAYLADRLAQLTSSRLAAWLSVALFCTSGPALFVVMCNGINDGWWMLGLLAVSCSERDWAVAVACVLSPWVDARFLLGLPLALCCRHVVHGRVCAPGWGSVFRLGAAACSYPAVRLVLLMGHWDGTSVAFVQRAVALVLHYMPNAYFGWWNGYRSGWVLILLSFWFGFVVNGRRSFYLTLAATLAGWACVTLLAADLTRSTNLLLPLFVAGIWAAVRSFGVGPSARLLLALLAVNLAMPFEMVTYDKSLLLHPLPFELFRLIRNRG